MEQDRFQGEVTVKLDRLEADVKFLRDWKDTVTTEIKQLEINTIKVVNDSTNDLKALISAKNKKVVSRENVFFFSTGAGLVWTILQALQHVVK